MTSTQDARTVLAVIPARYGATRFPGKPLAPLWGKPMLRHVWERARDIEGVDDLVVATDDDRIATAAEEFGAKVERTGEDCATGTDRVAQVAWRYPAADVVLNLQGDEPELDSEAVGRLVHGMRRDPFMKMATLAHREPHPQDLASDEVVKVETDADGWALYFTRHWPAPEWGGGEVLRHMGVYGFRRTFLIEFASWPPGEHEQQQRLEQLRALERGVRIRVYMSERPSAGIDTPEQLAALERRGPLLR